MADFNFTDGIIKYNIVKLYVAWFNRVPDAKGLSDWVEDVKKAGVASTNSLGQPVTKFNLDDNAFSVKINEISGKFYEAAATQFSTETGYSSNMSDNAFIIQLYDGVMGRTGEQAPNEEELSYWVNALNKDHKGNKGELVTRMIQEIINNKSDKSAIKAVKDKFNNKLLVANNLASDGSFTGSIAEGKEILTRVTENRADAISIINEYKSANNTDQETANKFLAKNDSDSLLAQIDGVTYSDNDAIPDYLSFDIDTNNVNTDSSVDGDNIITFIGIDQNEIVVSDIV